MLHLYNNNDVAKKFIKLKKQGSVEKGSVIAWMFFLWGLFNARNAGYISELITDIASIFSSALVFLGIGGKHIRERNSESIRRLAHDIKKATDQNCFVDSIEDIEVVPSKIQVGLDEDAVNIFPIYENGYYLVINSRPAAFVLRQLDVDGRKNVHILEPEEANEVIDELAVDNGFVRKKVIELKRSIEKPQR